MLSSDNINGQAYAIAPLIDPLHHFPLAQLAGITVTYRICHMPARPLHTCPTIAPSHHMTNQMLTARQRQTSTVPVFPSTPTLQTLVHQWSVPRQAVETRTYPAGLPPGLTGRTSITMRKHPPCFEVFDVRPHLAWIDERSRSSLEPALEQSRLRYVLNYLIPARVIKGFYGQRGGACYWSALHHVHHRECRDSAPLSSYIRTLQTDI